MEYVAVISRHGDWWHFHLPALDLAPSRPGGGPAKATGQARTRRGAIDGAAKIVSLITGLPEGLSEPEPR